MTDYGWSLAPLSPRCDCAAVLGDCPYWCHWRGQQPPRPTPHTDTRQEADR